MKLTATQTKCSPRSMKYPHTAQGRRLRNNIIHRGQVFLKHNKDKSVQEAIRGQIDSLRISTEHFYPLKIRGGYWRIWMLDRWCKVSDIL